MSGQYQDIKVEHVLNSLYQIEIWTRKVREVMSALDSRMTVMEGTAAFNAVLWKKLGPPIMRSECPPPLPEDTDDHDETECDCPCHGKGKHKDKKDKKDKKKKKKKDK